MELLKPPQILDHIENFDYYNLLVKEYALQRYIIITDILNSLNISYENVKQTHRIYGMCVIITYKDYEFSLSWSNLLARDKDWLVEILLTNTHFVFKNIEHLKNNLIRILEEEINQEN